jgi:hypothetical protein
MRRLDLRVVKLGFATRGAVHTCVHGAAGGEAEFYYS